MRSRVAAARVRQVRDDPGHPLRASIAPVVGKRLEEQLVHAAVGDHLRAAPCRHGQDHVQRRELAVVATAQITVATADALMRVAYGRAVMQQAELLDAPA